LRCIALKNICGEGYTQFEDLQQGAGELSPLQDKWVATPRARREVEAGLCRAATRRLRGAALAGHDMREPRACGGARARRTRRLPGVLGCARRCGGCSTARARSAASSSGPARGTGSRHPPACCCSGPGGGRAGSARVHHGAARRRLGICPGALARPRRGRLGAAERPPAHRAMRLLLVLHALHPSRQALKEPRTWKK
jgi:hypothetical protein